MHIFMMYFKTFDVINENKQIAFQISNLLPSASESKWENISHDKAFAHVCWHKYIFDWIKLIISTNWQTLWHVWYWWILIGCFITARIRRMGEGNVFTGVCLFTGGYPSPKFFTRSLVPGPFQGGTQSWPGSTPVLVGGTPSLAGGTLIWVTPWPGQDGVPPARTGEPHSAPPSPYPRIEQQSEYLLYGGQYTSCSNAGGLSCIYLYRLKKDKPLWLHA